MYAYLAFYAIMQFDNFKSNLVAIAAITTILAVVYMLYRSITSPVVLLVDAENNSKEEPKKKKRNILAPFLIICSLLMWMTNAFLPSSKDAAIILAAGKTYQVLTSDTAKEMASETTDAINRVLREVGVAEDNRKFKAEQTVIQTEPVAKHEEPIVETQPEVVVESVKAEERKEDGVKVTETKAPSRSIFEMSKDIIDATENASNSVNQVINHINK